MAIAALAAHQRGVVTRAQLLALGVTEHAVEYRLARGRLHAVHRGVYLVGHAAAPPLARETAAILACGEGVVLSHLAAGALWQLIPPRPPGEAVDVTTAIRSCRSRRGIRVHRVTALDPRDVSWRRGLTVTAPARTVVDLAAALTLGETEQAFAEAQALRLVSPKSVEAAVERAPGRSGVAAIKALLRFDAGPAWTRSKAERRMLALIRAAGLPEPEVNARVGRYTVDFLWRRERLVLEVDGKDFHSSGTAFERDRRKGTALVAMGLRVMRTTWRQILNEALVLVIQIDRGLQSDNRT